MAQKHEGVTIVDSFTASPRVLLPSAPPLWGIKMRGHGEMGRNGIAISPLVAGARGRMFGTD